MNPNPIIRNASAISISGLAKNSPGVALAIPIIILYFGGIYFREDLKRIALGREEYDQSDAAEMARMSSILGISDRKSYEEIDRKFNLTMY